MRWAKIAVVGAALALAISDGIRAVSHASSSDLAKAAADFPQHQAGGRAVLDGTNLYEAHNRRGAPYTASPVVAVAMVPFALVNEFWGSLLWFGLSIWMSVHALWLSARIAQRFWPSVFGGEFWLYAAACLLVWPFFWEELRWQNLSIVATYVLIASLWFYLRDRLCGAGLCVAVGVLLKIFPVLLLLYFAAKRRYAMVAYAAAWLLVLLVGIPSAVFGWKENQAYLSQWWTTVCVSAVAPDARYATAFYAQVYGLSRPNNYSLQAQLFQWITAGQQQHHAISRDVARLAGRAAAACVLLIGGFIMARRGGAERNQPRTVLEYCSVMILMLVASPVAWFHYFTMLALPVMVAISALASGIKADQRRAYGIGLAAYAAAAVALSAFNCSLTHAMFLGGVLVLGGSLLWVLARAESSLAVS